MKYFVTGNVTNCFFYFYIFFTIYLLGSHGYLSDCQFLKTEIMIIKGRNNLIKDLLQNNCKNCFKYIPRRGHTTWYPDPEFLKSFGGPVMYPDETTSKWKANSLKNNYNINVVAH